MEDDGIIFWGADPVTTIIILAVLGIVLVVGILLLVRYNKREPDVQRKWTDPKFHD